MKNKILRNMSGLLLLTLLAAYGIFCGVMYQQNVRTVKRQLAEETAYLAGGAEELGSSWLERQASVSTDGEKRITLIDGDGTVLYDSGSAAERMENHNERPEILQARARGCGEAERYSDTLQKKNFYYALALDNGQILRLSIATDSVYGTLQGQFSMVAILACLLFAISIAAAERLARRIVEPVNSLDLKHPLQNIDAYDELSPLLLRLEKQNRQIEEQMESLRARQAEFTAITENMQEGLIVLNRQLQVLSINESARKILDVETDGAAAGENRDLTGSEQRQPLRQEGQPLHILNLNRSQELLHAVRAAQTGEAGGCMLEHEGRQYSLLASPVVRSEKKGGVVIFLLDVTEQLEAERIRREFSANVSHELKTPLTSISGYAEIMENGLVKPEDIIPFAGRIHKEALRLINLIEDIIQLSRLDETNGNWQKETVELLPLCEEAAGRLSARAAERHVSVTVASDGSPRERLTVTGVRRLLDEMISNLCDNAIKYNKEGGQVTVMLEAVTAEDVPDNGADGTSALGGIRLTVSDTGIGIPTEHQSRIFERFYRVDKSHSRETGGTGLGLSIVKHAAAIHGARLHLDSEMGKGTVITVTFPVNGSDGIGLAATY